MEHSSSMNNTCLDLNLRHHPIPKKEMLESDFMELTREDETGALVEELNRVSEENKKLTEMLTVMCENYNALKTQVMEYAAKEEGNHSPHRKRKCEEGSGDVDNENNNLAESSSSDEESSKRRGTQRHREEKITSKISKVYVRTEASDTGLIVKDGYQWRKYGQKVTRDNPCPRAYFKCSFAPSCPVKKKVQRSVQDQEILVATYEGEHNHPKPISQADDASGSGSGARANRGVTTGSTLPRSTSRNSSAPAITLDLIKPQLPSKAPINDHRYNSASIPKADSPRFQQFLVEQMASSLTKDPDFTSALAAAISGKIFQQNSAWKW